MTLRIRALFRTSGQLVLLVQVVQGLFWLALVFHRCLHSNSGSCGSGYDEQRMIVLATTGVALLGWWATCRPAPTWRASAWLAPVCAGLLIVYRETRFVLAAAARPEAAMIWASLSEDLITVGPMILLILSYLGRPRLQVHEPTMIPWIGVLAGLVTLWTAIFYLGSYFPLPIMIDLLGTGVMYGLLRWRRPAKDAAPWAPTTLLLTAMTLPAYTVLFILSAGTESRTWFGTVLCIGIGTAASLAAYGWIGARRPAALTGAADHPPTVLDDTGGLGSELG